MSTDVEYWNEVISLPTFTRSVQSLTIQSVTQDLSDVRVSASLPEVHWNKALFVASLVTRGATERAFDGALRICQGCIKDPQATPTQHSGARLLLERLGNRRAIGLAQSRGIIADSALSSNALPLELEAIRQRIRLTFDTAGGIEVQLNDFQHEFLDAATEVNWVSASAPTSAGKSFIVKLWMKELFTQRNQVSAVYVVPTRALVEEVSGDLGIELQGIADIFTLPWDSRLEKSDKRLFVVTQERLHILQQRDPGFTVSAVFIDEAQKIGDGSRGILLQRVLDEALMRNDELKVLFASPLTENPEILLKGQRRASRVVASDVVMVNQNLIYANQVRGKTTEWNLDVIIEGTPHKVGDFSLPSRPSPASKRLPLVAYALGRTSAGNVVYANTAADAEKFGRIIADAVGESSVRRSDPEILALVDLIRRTIHPDYALAGQLLRGVAFHYGNMPLLVRQEVERLFREGKVQYLVCTSTLLEGVNLPCQNLFVLDPKKGNGNPMKAGDFWNLAGRAGRWGKEFEGNIICVDTGVANKWVNIPIRRTKQKIGRATDIVSSGFELLLAYDRARSPIELSKANPGLEAVYSLLSSRLRRGFTLEDASWFDLPKEQGRLLQSQMAESLSDIRIGEAVTSRHAGISPFSMERLADHFRKSDDPESLQLALPEDSESVGRMVTAMCLVNEYLGGKFGSHEGRHWQLAILLTNWMRGWSLSRLIADRVEYKRRTDPNFKLASVIRGVLADIEEMARFQAPLYFSCYMDILAEVNGKAASKDVAVDLPPDFFMMLELGVSRVTELSMIALGLTRTTAVELAEHIVHDNLSPEECFAWLRAANLDALDIPKLVIRDIRSALDRGDQFD